MTGMTTYMLVGLEQGRGVWSYQTPGRRPPDVDDIVVHPFSS